MQDRQTAARASDNDKISVGLMILKAACVSKNNSLFFKNLEIRNETFLSEHQQLQWKMQPTSQ